MALSTKFIFKSDGGVKNNNLVVYRTNFVCEKDVVEWLEEYSKETNTKWIVKNAVYNPQRLIYHKWFVCQHAAKNKKVKDSPRNTHCLSSINIKVKKCNKGTRKNDIFLRNDPPLAGIVKMNINHNHAVNPCPSEPFGSVIDNVAEIKEEIDYEYDANLGTKIQVVEHPWSMLVVSPIMRKCQELMYSREIISDDSTCSIDVTHSTLNIALTVSKAGALPICMLMHEGQTEDSYRRAFDLLKDVKNETVGGNEVNLSFVYQNLEVSDNQCDNRDSGISSAPPTTTKTTMNSYTNDSEDIEVGIRSLADNLSRIGNLLPKTMPTHKYLTQINRQLGRISTEQHALRLLTQANSLFRRRKRSIKVPPTSISKRRNGVSTGSKRVNSGRTYLSKNKKVRRKHSLSDSVNKKRTKTNAMLHE